MHVCGMYACVCVRGHAACGVQQRLATCRYLLHKCVACHVGMCVPCTDACVRMCTAIRDKPPRRRYTHACTQHICIEHTCTHAHRHRHTCTDTPPSETSRQGEGGPWSEGPWFAQPWVSPKPSVVIAYRAMIRWGPRLVSMRLTWPKAGEHEGHMRPRAGEHEGHMGPGLVSMRPRAGEHAAQGW